MEMPGARHGASRRGVAMSGFFATSMAGFLLDVTILMLLLIHCGWLALFCLEILFDTSQTTAAERFRILTRYVTFGLSVTGMIALLIFIRQFQPDWYQ